MSSSPQGDIGILERAAGFLLDLDGTVYLGDSLLPGAVEFVSRIIKSGRKRLFITNNCSKNPQEYSGKLTRLGIPTPPDAIFTSGELAAHYLLGRGISKVYVLGTPSLKSQLESFGLQHVQHTPQAVLSSFDLTLTYDKLLHAVRLVQRGVPLFSTHPDLVCPTPNGPIPDSGLITGMIESTTGVKAKYLGKPMTEMVDGAAAKMRIKKSELVFIGDRLYTDMRMALDAGIGAILVLSGETTPEMLAQSPYEPHLVAANLGALVEYI